MTVERQGERAKQSFKASQYLLQNPSNHVRDVTNCLQAPGISCRALNVKVSNTVDTETALIRGKQSEAVIITPTFASSPEFTPKNKNASFVNALGNSTRLPKSCYFEQPIPSRFEPFLHSPVQSHYVNENTKALFGMDTRNVSKYSN